MVGGALSRLQDDTVHLVYGLLEPPPQSLEAAHTSGLRTGLQRVQLLKPQAPRPALPPDTNAREIRMPDVVVPPETTYWCHMTELPEGFSRHHIVMVRGGPAPGGCPWAWFSPRPGRPVLQPRVRADLVAPLTAPSRASGPQHPGPAGGPPPPALTSSFPRNSITLNPALQVGQSRPLLPGLGRWPWSPLWHAVAPTQPWASASRFPGEGSTLRGAVRVPGVTRQAVPGRPHSRPGPRARAQPRAATAGHRHASTRESFPALTLSGDGPHFLPSEALHGLLEDSTWFQVGGPTLTRGSPRSRPGARLPRRSHCTDGQAEAHGGGRGAGSPGVSVPSRPQYEPIITKGNEALVHHMEVFQCPKEFPGSDFSGPCDSKMKPDRLNHCRHVLAAWALGAAVRPPLRSATLLCPPRLHPRGRQRGPASQSPAIRCLQPSPL